MSKRPILDLQKGCPFCGNIDNLAYGYEKAQNTVYITCNYCGYTITFKKAPPLYTPPLAELVWNSRADKEKPTAENTESTAEAILSELKDIKSYVAELAGYSIEK